LVAEVIFKKMKNEEAKKKHSVGRPKKDVKKQVVTAVRFTKTEYFVVKQKASKAGLRVTVYIRQMALQGQVISKMNDEERQFVRDLVGMSNNINQLAKKAHQEGLLKALLLFERYRDQLDLLLQRMKR
jgi:hypothetical protein